MRNPLDPLYKIFERYLFHSYLEEESNDDFVHKVVAEYLDHVQQTAVIPAEHRPSVESDLKDEVLAMLRKKIYGHMSLRSFRESSSFDSVPKAMSGRSRQRRAS